MSICASVVCVCRASGCVVNAGPTTTNHLTSHPFNEQSVGWTFACIFAATATRILDIPAKSAQYPGRSCRFTQTAVENTEREESEIVVWVRLFPRALSMGWQRSTVIGRTAWV